MRYCKIILIAYLVLNISQIVYAQTTLKIMTYNIQGMKPNTNHEIRLANIIKKMKILDPDIIGFQEINESNSGGGIDNQAKAISDSLSNFFNIEYNYYISKTHLAWDNKFGEFIGIITKHKVLQQGYKQLPAGLFPRRVVWNYINTPIGKINFFNTHTSFNSSSARINQIKQILPYIETQEEEFQGVATVLTGDFNDIASASSVSMITNQDSNEFYLDTYKISNPLESGNTVPSEFPDRRIDYIFYKNVGEFNIDTSYIVFDEPYSGNKYCSDHLGVMTIFSSNISNIVNDNSSIIKKAIELDQNYPNPFNPTTKIGFYIPKSGFVSLKIIDLQGNLISKLVDKHLQPGQYKINFNGENIASGLYFYTIFSGNTRVTKKMMLLR